MFIHHIAYLLLSLAFIQSCAEPEYDWLDESNSLYAHKLESVPQYLDLVNTLKTIPTLSKTPPMQAWRLLVPAKLYKSGPFAMEYNEPGYIKGIARAMDFALKNKDQKLTIELLEKIRTLATDGVLKRTKEANGSELNSQNYDKYRFYDEIGGPITQIKIIFGSNVSQAGYPEFKRRIQADSLSVIEEDKDNPNHFIMVRKTVSRQDISTRVQAIIDAYENKPQTSLRDIVVLIQDLIDLHPFNDANTRTLVIILLQKELARKGFTPALIENPKRFIGYTIDEILQLEIENGQRRYSYMVSAFGK